MECSLVMFKSDGTRKDIPLPGQRNVVGRMSSCEVRIPLNSISREHCELVCDGSSLRYKDLNSSNGVIHNGAKSKQGTLKAGDELVIGPVVFTVMIDGKPTKITPIRTILDEADDKAAGKAFDSKAYDSKAGDSKGLSRAGTVVASALVATPPPPKTPVPIPVQPSREIGSSGDQVEALKADSDFEEFNPPKPSGRAAPAIPALPDPIGDDDDEDVELAEPPAPAKPAPAKAASAKAAPAGDELASAGSGSDDFDFVDEAQGDDEEEPAFTF